MVLGVLGAVRMGAVLADNFTATQQPGTTFGSHVVSGVNYVVNMLCDYANGPAQCAAVNSAGSLQADWTTTSQAHADVTAPVPGFAATAWNTNTYVTGTTNSVSTDLHGNFWSDLGAVGGSAIALGQTTMSGSIPVVLPSNQAAIPVTSTSSDPCNGTLKTTANFTSTSSGGQIVAGTSAKKTYVCSLALFTSAITNVSFLEGTTTCTVGTAATFLNTGTTVANGAYLLAGGGMTLGNGNGTVFNTTTNADNLCIYFDTSNSPRVVGSVTYVQQ